MKFKILGLSVVALAMFAVSARTVAHPAYSAQTNRTVIANFPIAPEATARTGPVIIANYPINGVSAYPVAAPSYATYAPAHYTAVQVPVPVQMPIQVPLQHQYTQQASVQVIPSPQTHPVLQAAPVAVSQPRHGVAPLKTLRPVDCICARSATGAKVNVYKTAARWQASPDAQIGGGKKTVDVRGFHQGYWRVSYRNKSGGVKYGWVREGDLVCKTTRVMATGHASGY